MTSACIKCSLTRYRDRADHAPPSLRHSHPSVAVAECGPEVGECRGIPNGRPSNTKKALQSAPFLIILLVTYFL